MPVGRSKPSAKTWLRSARPSPSLSRRARMRPFLDSARKTVPSGATASQRALSKPVAKRLTRKPGGRLSRGGSGIASSVPLLAEAGVAKGAGRSAGATRNWWPTGSSGAERSVCATAAPWPNRSAAATATRRRDVRMAHCRATATQRNRGLAASRPGVHRPPMETVPDELVRFAHELADADGAVLRRWFRTGVASEAKPDESPVTRADPEAETGGARPDRGGTFPITASMARNSRRHAAMPNGSG